MPNPQSAPAPRSKPPDAEMAAPGVPALLPEALAGDAAEPRRGIAGRAEVWIPGLYALMASAWIAFSDLLVASAVRSVRQQALWSVAKGFGFVAVTATLLHAGLRWALARQRRAHRRVATSEAMLRAITEAVPDPMFVKDAAGVWLFANRAVAAVLGRPPGEIVGKRDVEIYDDRALAEALAANDRIVLASGESRVLEESVETTAGLRLFLTTKSPLRDGRGRVVGLVGVARDITARKRAEEALRDRERRFRALIEKSSDMIAMLDGEGRWSYWSPSAVEVLGWSSEERVGRPLAELVHPDDGARVADVRERVLSRAGETSTVTFRARHRDGTWRELHATARNLLDDAAVQGVVVNVRDVTGQRLLEDKFRQAQKLESVGRLAGGVAHDFNNLLTVILSCADELLDERADPAARRADAEEIRAAAGRARELTRQLLAFARKQVIAPVPLDLNALVRGTEKLLRRVLGEDIRLATCLAPDLPHVCCDPGQLDQVLMNLSVNARDAMPGGGTLTLETSAAEACAGAPGGDGDRPHAWVRLSVRDSGVGMSDEVKAHLFEPFFTTKRQGSGTGLGLATVHGIVGQAGGHVHVESAPGRGTTFTVCLPPSAAAEPRPPADPAARAARGTGTVLVVEDDAQVRRVTVRALEGAGYRVLAAADADEALALARREELVLDLVVTDVVMPGPSGRALVRELERRRPGIRALYVSGYTPDAIAHRGVLDDGVQFLSKPFTPATLLERVRQLLAAAA